MSAYSVVMDMIQRERKTRERIDGMDTPDLVEEIHTLEDKIEELERDSDEAHQLAEHYRVHIARLKAALHEISLCSQNSMSSKEECGRIARAAAAVEC